MLVHDQPNGLAELLVEVQLNDAGAVRPEACIDLAIAIEARHHGRFVQYLFKGADRYDFASVHQQLVPTGHVCRDYR